jgi:hypothetical protein
MVLMKTFASSVKEVEERIGLHVTIATSGSTWCALAWPFCQKMMRFTTVLIAKRKKITTTDFRLKISSLITDLKESISLI